jgi:hypothetical protein
MVDLIEFEFCDALQRAGLDKDYGPLIRLLRSNYALSAKDKCGLADLLEGKIKRPRGNHMWRATDAFAHPDQAAVRHAVSLIQWIKKVDKKEGKPTSGRHERAIRQAIDYMKEKGFRVPKRGSLENYLRRSNQPRKKRSTKS